VRQHPTLKRKGSDIYSDVDINLAQAVLGTKVKVESLDGPVNLRIPPGIQPGQKLRLKGRGVKKLNGTGRGDHYVQVNVKIPESLNESEREAFTRFAETAKLKR
jgi:molecular chaperone DnaJ